jgi:hypothetical protein
VIGRSCKVLDICESFISFFLCNQSVHILLDFNKVLNVLLILNILLEKVSREYKFSPTLGEIIQHKYI